MCPVTSDGWSDSVHFELMLWSCFKVPVEGCGEKLGLVTIERTKLVNTWWVDYPLLSQECGAVATAETKQKLFPSTQSAVSLLERRLSVVNSLSVWNPTLMARHPHRKISTQKTWWPHSLPHSSFWQTYFSLVFINMQHGWVGQLI